MKKYLLNVKNVMLFLICVLCALPLVAQDAVTEDKGKPNVFIDYFSGPRGIPFAWIESLRNSVISGINETGRVALIDVDSRSALAIEKERRESGEVVAGDDMERMKVMTSEGANYLIQGHVGTFEVTSHKDKEGKLYWKATCSYTLKVINPSNGKLVSTKNFSHGDGFLLTVKKDTKEGAVAELCSHAVYSMRDLVEEAFKMEGIIIQIVERKKKDKEAKTVYINIGSKQGVNDNTYFSVCIENKLSFKSADGTDVERISQREIGRIKAEVVEGEDITLCEVKKGGEEIVKAFEQEQKLIVKSIPKPGIF